MKIRKFLGAMVSLVFIATLFCFTASAEISRNIDLVGCSYTYTYLYTTGGITRNTGSIPQPNTVGNSFVYVSSSNVSSVTLVVNLSSPIVLSSDSDYQLKLSLGAASGSSAILGIKIHFMNNGSIVSTFTPSTFSSAACNATITSDYFLGVSSFDAIQYVFTFNGYVGSVWIGSSPVFSEITGTDKIIDNQNKNSQEIQDKIDENFDKILDGDGTELAPDSNKEMDALGGQMSDLESGALGGKSDEEIEKEVDNALSFDMDSIDKNTSQKMAKMFDGLLIVFGVDYQSLLMLALSLGLAAFIIGRRYKGS